MPINRLLEDKRTPEEIELQGLHLICWAWLIVLIR